MGESGRKTRKRLFMVLYVMLLCFHLQSSNKMKESEHKKSTILNFNKTRGEKESKKKHRTVSAGECSEMAKMIASRRCSISGFEANLQTTACSSHTRRRRFFTYREIFMFINFISKRSSWDKCCVHSGGCCCWFSVLYFERLDVFVSGRRACSEQRDVWTITMAMQSI